jgi:ubiquinone/menaquinone biosynthesis C-methylase UbiE
MISSPDTAPATLGRVLHWAAGYDLLVWLLTRRSDRAFREQLASFAHLSANESVLDIGCGTGTLAIVAKGQVGATGKVFGIDASPAMIARAAAKAARAGIDVCFKNALAEALPFPEGQFDVVLSTLMLHHLPGNVRQQCAREIRRVLKPQGRALVVDFAHAQPKSGFLAHFHRHGHVDPQDVVALLEEADLRCVESGSVGISSLHFVRAVAVVTSART